MNGESGNAKVIVLLGAPGSGKGTQGAKLSSEIGMPVLSTGEMLRSLARQNTAAGRQIKSLLAAGQLVSDEIVCSAVEARLGLELCSSRAGAILDGFPRTLGQAKRLDNMLENLGLDGPLVIHLDVSAPDILGRLTSRRQCPSCGAIYNLQLLPSRRGRRCEADGIGLIQRDDDRKEVIERRLADFDVMSAPLIAHYKNGDYHRIVGNGRPDEIAGELISACDAALSVCRCLSNGFAQTALLPASVSRTAAE